MSGCVILCFRLGVGEEEEEEYKGRTDSNSLTGPNEAVCLLHYYYYNIYVTERKGQQSGKLLPNHPSLQPKLAGRGSDTM